jgi:hypothetical protein
MRLYLAALALFLSLLVGAPAQSPKSPITKDNVRQAIALFREDPTSERGRGAASIIVHFAEESADVEVVISPSVLPWLGSKPTPKYSDTLLAAYLAGTVRSQLESGVTKSDPVAGVEQVIETYLKLKKTEPNLRVPVVETFIQLKTQGKLKEHLETK